MTRAGRVLVAVLALGLAACTPDAGSDAEGPRLVETECPPEVEIQVVPEHTCGFVVTVSRAGTEQQLFVVAVEPPSPSDLAPVLETGTDLGMSPGYAGLAPIAQRTSRRVVIVALPGTGLSTPSLDCPEVRGLHPVRTGPGSARLVGAVAGCRSRLEAAGADLAAASPEVMGDLLHDVMVAFGEPRWVVMGHGTSAVAALHLGTEHPDSVEAVVLDSVVHTDDDPLATMTEVVAGVAAECRARAGCERIHGDVQATWRQARRTLAARPLTVRSLGMRLRLDEGELIRAARWLVAPDALGPERLPQLLAEAVQGRGPLLRQYAASRLSGPAHCVGFLPKCEGDDLAFGAVLSSLCPEVARQRDWRAPCRAWGVPGEAEPPAPLTGVPVLALHGRYDPFAAPADVRARLAEVVPEAYVIESPTGGHNVLADECVRGVRNAWLADLQHEPPLRPQCLTDPLEFDPAGGPT